MDVIVALVIIFSFGVFAWVRFRDALLLLMGALPLYVIRLSPWSLPTTVLELMILSLAAVWIARGEANDLVLQWREGRHNPLIRMLPALIGLFFLASAIGVAVSQNTISALGLFRAYWIEPLLLFLIIISTVRTRKDIFQLFGAFTISGCSIAVVALVQKFTGWTIPAPWIEERRATSIYPFPNAVGLYLAPIIPLAIAYAREKVFQGEGVFFWRCFGGLGLLLLFAGIISAKTEGALVALAACAVVLGICASARSRVIVCSLLAVAVLVFVALPPATQDDIARTLTLRDWSGKVRKSMWAESSAMLSDRWLLGAGIGGYQEAMVPYHKAKHLEIFLYPHTIVLNFWTETGVIGVLAFFLLVVAFYLLLARDARDRVALAIGASMTIILIHGLVDVPYFKNDLAVFFWFLLAIATVRSFGTYSSQEAM